MSAPTSPNDPGHIRANQPPRPQGLAFALSFVTIAMYCGFVMLVAYAKGFLGTEIIPGLSWGILLGALVIVASWVLTYIYVAATSRRVAQK